MSVPASPLATARRLPGLALEPPRRGAARSRRARPRKAMTRRGSRADSRRRLRRWRASASVRPRGGRETLGLAEDGDARVVRAAANDVLERTHLGATRWVPPAHAPGPVGTPGRSLRWAARSASAASAAAKKTRKRANKTPARIRARRRSTKRRAKEPTRPRRRRRLDLLRSLGVVKSNGGVPSTYNVSAAFAKRPLRRSGVRRFVAVSERLVVDDNERSGQARRSRFERENRRV